MNTRDNPDNNTTYLLLAGGYLLITLLAFRISPSLAFTLFIIGAAAALGWFFVSGKQKLTQLRRLRAERNTFGGRIRERLRECEQKEAQFRSESDYIRERIKALREDLERGASADETEKARAQVLIKEFEAEFNLRHAKASFFSDCVSRLKDLLARHQLHQSIADRKRELDELRKSNFDDEAAMEETRYHLEQDTIQLDTIAELSKDAAVSFKAEQAEELRSRLEKLRSSLGKLPGENLE